MHVTSCVQFTITPLFTNIMAQNTWTTNPISGQESVLEYKLSDIQDKQSKNSKLRVSFDVSQNLLVPKSLVHGSIRITSTTSTAKIGSICLLLVGYHNSITTRVPFLQKTIVIQSIDTAPTDCIHSGRADENAMWSAKKGTSQIPFTFRFPSHSDVLLNETSNEFKPLPPSLVIPGVGSISYSLTLIVNTKINEKVASMQFTLPLEIINSITQTTAKPESGTSEMLVSYRKSLRTKTAKVSTTASVVPTCASGNLISGEIAFVNVKIQNALPSAVSLIDLFLIQI